MKAAVISALLTPLTIEDIDIAKPSTAGCWSAPRLVACATATCDLTSGGVGWC